MHRIWRRIGAFVCLFSLLAALTPASSAAADPPEPLSDSGFIPAVAAVAGAPTPQDGGPWVVRAYYTDDQMVRNLAVWNEPWEVNRDAGYVVVEVDQDEYARLLAAGFRMEIDAQLTTQLRRPNVMLPGQVSGIPSYPCYRTVEETFASAANIAAAYPNLAAWIDAGDSWEKMTPGGNAGYDLRVLKLTNTAISGPKPTLFVMSSIHAREYATAELNTRFAEYLVANYGVDPDVTWLLDYHEIHLLLHANPDGRKKAETGLLWRKNTNEKYCSATSNSRGADLNRNYAFRWGCCGGSSGAPCDETYRGPTPASEPETQMVQNYVRAQFPDQRNDDLTSAAPLTTTGVFLDLHSYSQLVLWSWGFTASPPPNSAGLRTLGRKFAYFNGYVPDQAMSLYATDGTTDDFAYGELGLAAYTFELGTAFFQSCSVFENTILPNNLPALLYAAKAARTPYMTPSGPDALNVTTLPGSVTPGATVRLSATINDTRYNNQKGTEPTQPIAAAEYYVDVPPWDAAAVAHPMTATDGTFNATVEAVAATLDTTGLQEGRHIFYVRGQDTNGNWGVVSAAFLHVLDPATAPVIEGYVRDAHNRAPLAATVTAGAFQAATNPPTGYYSLTLISGTYSVQAVAAGYAISTVSGVVVTSGAHLRQDFSLYPICNIFTDNVESGNKGWTAQGNWAITAESSHSPTRSWTDSPGGVYGNNWNYSLTSPLFDLSGYSGVTLNFWHTYVLETGYDYGYLEYSTNGGSSWSTQISYNGEDQTTWRQEAVSLPAVDGRPNVRFRFRLNTDGYLTRDGWHIDDIVLSGGGPACPSVLPPYDFVVTPNAVAQAGLPGSAVSYTFQVTNTGSHADVLSVTVAGGAWAAAAPVGVGPVSAGESASLPLTVTVPATALCGDGDVVTVTLTSQGDPERAVSVAATTTAQAVYGVVLDADERAYSGDPGQMVSYTIAITNAGNCGDTFALSASGKWPFAVPASLGPLLAGTGDVATVAVTLPGDALAQALDVTTLRATSQGDVAQKATVALTTTANTVYAAALTPPSLALDGPPGTAVVHTFVLSNTGNITGAFTLATQDIVWPTALVPTATVLGPGSATPVVVTVTIPFSAALLATDTGRLVVSGTGAAVHSDFTTTALLRREVALYATPAAQGALLGEIATYVVSVTNTGNIEDVFTVTVSGASWPTAFAPEVVAVGPRETTSVAVTVTVPITATPGATDTVTVAATSHVDSAVSASLHLTTEALCVDVSGASFSYTPLPPLIGQAVTFTGEVETGTPPVTFTWNFGDGSGDTGSAVTHTFPVGTALLPYTVAMTARNVCSLQVVRQVIAVQPHRVYLPAVLRNQ